MKKTYTAIIIGTLLSSSLSANEQKLIFFKDLTHYKEKSAINLDDKTYIELSDTAVLDSVNVQIFNEKNERVNLKNIEIMEQSEDNIFKVNKNSKIFINDKEYTLISNGGDFLKVLEGELTVYIPKTKINSISFNKDINGNNHLVKLTGFSHLNNAKIQYSYTFGNINWNPKYNLYLLDNNKALLDYNIQIDNNTSRNFEDVEMKFISEPIQRYYSNYSSSENDYIFSDKKNKVITPIPQYNNYNARMEMQSVMEDSMVMKSNSITHNIESGKRVLDFSGKVNIPANTSSSFSYLMDKELQYNKTNNYSFNYNLIDTQRKNLDTPLLSININREESKYQLPLSAGVVRVFSKRDVFDNQLLKEESISDKQNNEDLNFNLGNNYNISIDSQEKSSDFNSTTIFKIQGKDYEKNYPKINNRRSDFDYLYNKSIIITKIDFNVTSTKIDKNEKLNINFRGNQYFTTSEDQVKNIKDNIEDQAEIGFGQKQDAISEYNLFENKIKRQLENKITYKEQDLINNKKTVLYLITFY